jgi:hypothetical protein
MRTTFLLKPLLAALLSATTAAFPAEDDEVVVGARQVSPEEQSFEMTFDQWLFHIDGSEQAAMERLGTVVDLQLSELESVCQLGDEQKKRLRLAARGDMQRFLDESRVLRRKFDASKKDQEIFNEMSPEVELLMNKMIRGLTGAGSLFAKVVPTALTPDKAAQYEVVLRERRLARYRASIAATLHSLEDAVALKQDQREALTKLLLDLPAPLAPSQYDYYVILIRLSNFPPEKLQSILNQRQWEMLERHMDQYRRHKDAMVAAWTAGGILIPEDLLEPKAAAETPEVQP